MQFEIRKQRLPEPAADQEAVTWALVKTDGTVLCQGPHTFYDEKQARSQIAEAKKSMKGAMRCRVVTLDGS